MHKDKYIFYFELKGNLILFLKINKFFSRLTSCLFHDDQSFWLTCTVIMTSQWVKTENDVH